jgi:hypothetical protein
VALNPKQETYCLERARGASVAQASETVGVTDRTGRNWEHDPGVAARIDELQALAVTEALRYLRAHILAAARRLVELTQPGRMSAAGATNLAACKDVLDRAGLKPVERREETITVRREAEKLAVELGLEVADVLAEAERIMRAG